MARELDKFKKMSIIDNVDANTWFGGASYVVEFFMLQF